MNEETYEPKTLRKVPNTVVHTHSWILVPPEVAIKELDKSAFLHNGTGIPIDMRYFFDIEEMARGDRREITLIYRCNSYSSRVEMDRQNSPRTRLLWKSDFTKVIQDKFPQLYNIFRHNERHTGNLPKLKLTKISPRSFLVEFLKEIILDTKVKDIESEETEIIQSRTEGLIISYHSNRYERDPINRKRAIEIHGLSCFGCGFNFEVVYGEWGKDFIEIHHINPLSTFNGEEVLIDPSKDLVPLCSNCHRMVHRRHDEMLSIERLKRIIKRSME